MSKKNTIFRNIHNHLKNEHNMEDEQARVLAKQALVEFRSDGDFPVIHASKYCNGHNPDPCDSNSRFRTIEGVCNNIDKPTLGAFDTKFIREVEGGSKDVKNDITIFDPKKSK